jgi:hypothetical protein
MFVAALVVGVLSVTPAGSITDDMVESETQRALSESGITAKVLITTDAVVVRDAERRGDGRTVDPAAVASVVWARHMQGFDELVVRTLVGDEHVFTRSELRTTFGPRPADLVRLGGTDTAGSSNLAEPFLAPIRILAIGVGVAAAALTIATVAVGFGAADVAGARRTARPRS